MPSTSPRRRSARTPKSTASRSGWATRRAGLTVYEHRDAAYAYVHAEVDPSFSGRGLATQLVRSALDTMRDRHLEVLPFCPIVGEFVQRHPDYLDLVPADQRPRFDLPAAT